MHIHHVFCLVFSLFQPVFTDEDYYQVSACCSYKGPHFEDIEYTIIFRFNKHKMMEYNSTRGNWTGFTPYSIATSRYWNSDPYDALERRLQKELLCHDNANFIQSLGNLSTTPTVNIKLVKQPSGGHPAMLVCSAYNFYPKQVRMTWLRNKQEVITGVGYSDVMADGDLYYQMHVYLEYTPTSGENITCMVEHFSLSEPKIVVWDNSLPAEAQIQITIGLCGLIFGLIILSSGLIYYKKKSAAYITFCRATQT
ncbi:rano class II histocompatibility antigen, A beta chain-like isoform X3 [Melanotaenia boesemani]|uniref:rano class II histocompatibility antigen, A beta chain-like isoform X3 n=1 Tax=Melanotaenia boesemani TaxID=1250792 RepID=UPI001C04BACA|nr:rano class II histocompatibility antigen, A beta chain-like isoform X3 [Melanotaenia boesemani]